MPLTSLSDLPRPFGCTLFLCLNFSSQAALLALKWLSEMPKLVAKNLAFSRIITSVNVIPCFLVFFTHTANARSMSGNLPLLRLTGDLLPSSGNKYFSFCRRTLDTVLYFFFQQKLAGMFHFVRWSKKNKMIIFPTTISCDAVAIFYLLSTPNIAFINAAIESAN